jgi:hypothetical protein
MARETLEGRIMQEQEAVGSAETRGAKPAKIVAPPMAASKTPRPRIAPAKPRATARLPENAVPMAEPMVMLAPLADPVPAAEPAPAALPAAVEPPPAAQPAASAEPHTETAPETAALAEETLAEATLAEETLAEATPAAAPAAAPHDAGWADRIRAGNLMLQDIFPNQMSRIELPNPLDFNSATLLFAPSEGATRLLLTFGGNTGYLMLPPPVVMEPNMHVLALRDPLRCFAIAGLPGLGATYDHCLNSIRRLLMELDVDEIYCCGVSAGGYPALRFGLDLQADGVLAFSTPTTLDLADDPDAPMSRYPQLSALYRRKPDIPLDLARAYRASRTRPRASLVFSPSNERDSWLARRMDGIGGVELEEVSPEADHRVFLWLNTTKGIQPYYNRLFDMRRIEGAATA